jgi:type I restriction enzyme S subunit
VKVSGFPTYDAYKETGVEWLGKVPAHWEVRALRAVASLKIERNRSDLPVLSVYREYGVIPKDSRDDNHNATSLDTGAYKVVEPGDLAVNKMKAWQGSLGVSEHHGIVSPAYITCGLNPYVKLKPSGIDWIGEIPEGWEVKPGLAYFNETDVRSTTGDEELLSVSHITGVTPRREKNITMFMAESYEGSKVCEIGDVAVNAVNTMWAWMAALGVSKYRGLISPSYNTYCQKKPEAYHPDFRDLLLRSNSYKGHYFVNSSGITTSRHRLYPHPFLRLKFLRPPHREQEKIVEHCSQVSAIVKKSTSTVKEQIESLKKLRNTLIAHAVTGRLNVSQSVLDRAG